MALAAVLSAIALTTAPAMAADGIALEVGQDSVPNAKVRLVRVGGQWKWKQRWFESGSWHIGGYWDLQGGYWDNSSEKRTNGKLWEVAVTPVVRLQQNRLSEIAPYGEIGIGAHLLSETSITDARRFSTAFQFGSHAGIGARFGPNNAFDLSYRFQHLSNASIKTPNDGMDFHVLRLGYWF